MTQKHFETIVYFERKVAKKALKLIGRQGFIEATSPQLTVKHALDNFRIVIYHEALKDIIASAIANSDLHWVEKDLTQKSETEQ